MMCTVQIPNAARFDLLARRSLKAIVAAFVLIAGLLSIPSAAFAITVQTVPAPTGMDVWLSEEHSLPMIAVSVSLPAGSAYDPKGKEGLSALTASLLDEGAGDLDAVAFRRALESRAIRFSASAERDYVIVSMQTLSAHRNEAFRLLGLALMRPRFDADAIDRMRSAILASLRSDEEDPSTVAAKAWYRAYFGTHPYAHDDDGTPEGLKAVTAEDIRAFTKAHLVRGGAKVSVSGDITPGALAKVMSEVFGPLPSQPPPPTPKPERVGAAGTKILPLNIPQPAAVFGFSGPKRADPDFIPTYVANYIFGGGGFSSRLMNEVRDKRGLTYGIFTGVTDYRAAGIVVGRVESDKATISEALDVVRSELVRFARDGASEKELADAKTYLIGSFPLSFDSNVRMAATLNGFQRVGLGADYVEKRNALVGAVTLERVNAVAKKYFDSSRLTVVVAGTPAKPKASVPKGTPSELQRPKSRQR
ncbi:MAG: M16 family metallopeptidase [Alphaproteobacteria bacterium]